MTELITCERLRQTYSKGDVLTIYNEIKQEGDFLGFARQFMHSEDYLVARNALWELTKMSKAELSQLQVILNEFINLAMETDNSSVRRLSLSIIERLKMEEKDLRTDFLDFCLEHMVSIEELSSIQSLCMKIAFRICKFYPELMKELKVTIEAMEIDYYKPAVRSIRKKILSMKMK
jgi:hypothetical protein